MEQQELFDLRKKRMTMYSTPKGLLVVVNNILGDVFKIPVVIGNHGKNFEPDWKITYASPYREADELTVRNYIAGLRKLNYKYNQNEHSPANFKGFRGIFDYEGFDNRIGRDKFIMGISISSSFSDTNSRENRAFEPHFSLDLYWEGKSSYTAQSTTIPSLIDKIMLHFMGPNHKQAR